MRCIDPTAYFPRVSCCKDVEVLNSVPEMVGQQEKEPNDLSNLTNGMGPGTTRINPEKGSEAAPLLPHANNVYGKNRPFPGLM